MGYFKITAFALLNLFQTMSVYSIQNQTQNEKEFLKRCPPFECGKLGKVNFPFARISDESNCGPFPVDNCDGELPKMKLSWDSPKWFVLNNVSQFQDVNYGNKWSYNITYTDTKRQQHFKSRDCQSFNPVTLPVFQFPGSVVLPKLIKLIKCNHSLSLGDQFQFRFECPNFNIYYNYINGSSSPTVPLNCSTVSLPVHSDMGYESYRDIFEVLTATVSLQVIISVECYLCPLKDGQCQQDIRGQWRCLNHLGTEIAVFPQPTRHDGMNVTITATATAAAILILLIITLWYMRRRFSSFIILCWNSRTQGHQNIEDFLRSHGQLTLRRYRYSQIKKMTGTFKEKLGQGGYGAVFKGELPNGCLVAVKLLKDSKSNGTDFINEVATISRTSHINIVTLLGFCFEGSKRALIYEFIPNGSLEKYLCKNKALEPNHRIGWEKLFEIAVRVANGLEYLHRGCNTRILHFDIKPHNILLDENFCPKISDFGLAKICTKRESIVSMIEARGTIGYIAPEVFCRNFGGVSHKSDVYSYGMLVIDIVGGRKNFHVDVDNGSDIYFPNWIYKSITEGEENGVFRMDKEVENEIAKKLVLVSLWCIQPMPSNRPTMSRVVEMLQASFESLPIPPRPNISSPSRPISIRQSMADSSTVNTIIA